MKAIPLNASQRALVDDFVRAARQARRAGFDFVDVKHCHGYLGHEFLSAVDRPGRYGGAFENRTRFVREVVAGIRAEAPGLMIGVRLSAMDWVPFRKGPGGRGEPGLTGGWEWIFMSIRLRRFWPVSMFLFPVGGWPTAPSRLPTGVPRSGDRRGWSRRRCTPGGGVRPVG